MIEKCETFLKDRPMWGTKAVKKYSYPRQKRIQKWCLQRWGVLIAQDSRRRMSIMPRLRERQESKLRFMAFLDRWNVGDHDKPELYYPSRNHILEKPNACHARDSFDVFVHSRFRNNAWVGSVCLRSPASFSNSLLPQYFWFGVSFTTPAAFQICNTSYQSNRIACIKVRNQYRSDVDVFHRAVDNASCKNHRA